MGDNTQEFVKQIEKRFLIHEGRLSFVNHDEWLFRIHDVVDDKGNHVPERAFLETGSGFELPDVCWKLYFDKQCCGIIGEGYCRDGIIGYSFYSQVTNYEMEIEFLGEVCSFPYRTKDQLCEMISELIPEHSDLLHHLSYDVPIGYLLGILCGLTPGYEKNYGDLVPDLLDILETQYAINSKELFYPNEKERCFLRDKIVVLEDMDTRDAFYRKEIGPNWDESFREMKVLNWNGDVRYLIIDYQNEFVIVISKYSQLEIMNKELWDDENHDYVFSQYDESFPGCTAASRYTFAYAVLSEAWTTPYFELLRKLVNSFMDEPKFRIITLCGSTRFKDEFLEVQKRLTLEGNIVISVGLFGHSGDNEVWEPGTKEMLDEMHKRKIDLANEIFVINKGGYIGSSTRSEIEYAKATGKAVRFMEVNDG